MNKKLKNSIKIITAIAVCCYLALNIYTRNSYKAVNTTLDIYRNDFLHYSDEFGDPKYYEWDDYIAYLRRENRHCFIFYPGGKVAPEAYIPLAAMLADRGIDTLIAEMPFNLAVLDIDAAEKHRGKFENTEHFYIGGHSLGGAMAASYLAGDDAEKYDGLILLGAYSTRDLSQSDNVDRVLSVTASNDMVMNWEKYNECLPNLPENTTEVIIDGGCHSYFGCYGMQDGDGTPAISWEEQTVIIADTIADFVFGNME